MKEATRIGVVTHNDYEEAVMDEHALRTAGARTGRWLRRALSVVLLGLTASMGSAVWAAPVKMIVNNDTQESSLKGRTWDHFRDLMVKSLAGKVDVEVHHNSSLYTQQTEVQALMLGGVHAISPVVGVYTGTFPKLAVLVLPYLLPGPKAIDAAVKDPAIGGELFKNVEAKGIEIVGIWLNGPRDVGRKGAPILTPAEAKGVKIRVPGGSNYVDAWKAVGANVITMSWSEVPAALQQGVIDAVEPVPNAWYSSHLYEIADHITEIKYIWDFYIVGVNKAWYDELDPDVHAKMQKIFDETTAWNWQSANQANAQAKKKMAAEGARFYQLTPAQMGKWVDAMRTTWKTLGTPLVGQIMMDRLEAIGKKFR